METGGAEDFGKGVMGFGRHPMDSECSGDEVVGVPEYSSNRDGNDLL